MVLEADILNYLPVFLSVIPCVSGFCPNFFHIYKYIFPLQIKSNIQTNKQYLWIIHIVLVD